MRLISIVGARPQLVKVAVLSAALRQPEYAALFDHRIVHTGQHYDQRMSECILDELDIPEPDVRLGVGSGSHGAQTGAMLVGIESALEAWRPEAVIVYGDTNSTLAGALSAAKLHIPVCHIEAGLRSFNRRMPEEINRIATDHISDLLLCPTLTAMTNMRREGLQSRSWLVGDVMLDLVKERAPSLPKHPLSAGTYALLTMHRAENTDAPDAIDKLMILLTKMPIRVVVPMHPRLRARLSSLQMRVLAGCPQVEIIEPASYDEMLALERDACVVLTDSGGVQKEAYFLGVPCLTLRRETEWKETLVGGWNHIVGLEPETILPIVNSLVHHNGYSPYAEPDLSQFGSGRAAKSCLNVIRKIVRGEAA